MTAAGAPAPRLLRGWGRTAPTLARVAAPEGAAAVARAVAGAPARGVLARGLGRSYGDAAQNAGGEVLDTSRLDEIAGFELTTGVVAVGAGVTIDRLIRLGLPHGWFVPVTPGTRQVTVGGAIAADVHGKNHHREGAFTSHVEELQICTPADGLVTVRPGDDLFAATAGGMGLTGVITAARLRMLRVTTSRIRVDTERCADLDAVIEAMTARDDEYRYSVAWLDSLARGKRLGRAVLTRGDHAGVDELAPRERAEPLAFSPPVAPPAPIVPDGLLNRSTIAAFNELWFRRAPRREEGRIESIGAFFHPLDGIADWNRLYGPGGFVQYQAVVPLGREDALRLLVLRLASARAASFLTVLKRFGPGTGLLSFPIAGWTLALDLPARLPGLAGVLDALDEVVAEAGGRVYLAKDARLRPDTLGAMYPELPAWREIRRRADPDSRMCSDLARRLGLVEDG